MIKITGTGWFKSDGEIGGFTCKCDKCGSNNIEINDSIAHGSEWTGQYGSIDIICLDCKNQEEIYS